MKTEYSRMVQRRSQVMGSWWRTRYIAILQNHNGCICGLLTVVLIIPDVVFKAVLVTFQLITKSFLPRDRRRRCPTPRRTQTWRKPSRQHRKRNAGQECPGEVESRWIERCWVGWRWGPWPRFRPRSQSSQPWEWKKRQSYGSENVFFFFLQRWFLRLMKQIKATLYSSSDEPPKPLTLNLMET